MLSVALKTITGAISGIGPEHEQHGQPTQLALFTREEKS